MSLFDQLEKHYTSLNTEQRIMLLYRLVQSIQLLEVKVSKMKEELKARQLIRIQDQETIKRLTEKLSQKVTQQLRSKKELNT